MMDAFNAVKGGMSVYHAVKRFKVPRSTLRDCLKNRVSLDAKPGRKPMLTEVKEKKLIDYASNRAQLGIGFGKHSFLKYAASLAAKYRKPFKKHVPSNKWWRLLQRRHSKKISLRQPEGTASIRHQCMETEMVANYLDNLKKVLNTVSGPSQAWNMDETGLQLDVKPRKVVAAKGTKYLHSRTSGNRETLTVIACMNADGAAIPPHVIVKGVTAKSLMGFSTECASSGTNWSCFDSGWTKQGFAQLWFTKTFYQTLAAQDHRCSYSTAMTAITSLS
jgi:hypothetical protein